MFRTLFLLALLVPACFAADPPEYLRAADLVKQQNWQEALPILDGLLGRYPDNPKLLNLYGLALIQASKMPEARAAFENALHSNPNFSPALKNLSIVEWSAGMQEAARDTEAALRAEPHDPVLNAYGSLAAMARHDPLTAVDRLRAAGAATAALPPELLYKLGVQLAETELFGQSIPLFQQLIEAGRDSPGIRYNLALAQFRTERYREAVETLRFHAPSSDAMNLLAQAYEKSGESQHAVDTWRDAISKYPNDENNYLDLANICVDIGSLDKAINVIRAGLASRPDSSRLNIQAGLLWILSGDFGRARLSFERAAELAPRSDLPQAAIELADIQQSNLTKAVAELRRQVQEKPNSAVLWYLLGTALTHSGAADQNSEQKEAVGAYKKAIQIDPKFSWPYVELAKIYVRWRHPQDAVALLEKVIGMDAESRSAYYQLALAYREMNQPERAREMLAKVRQLNAREHTASPPSPGSPESQ